METTADKLTYLQETKNAVISTLTDKLSGFITFDASKETFRNLCTKYVNAVGATSIGDSAFRDCTGLTSVTIGDSVTSIGSYAFDSCSALASITIGNSVTIIGDRAFENLQADVFTVKATTPPTIGSDGLFGKVSSHEWRMPPCPIYVPSASVDDYKNDFDWSNYAAYIEADPNE